MQTPRPSTSVAARRQAASRTDEARQPPSSPSAAEAGAPQPIDAELLKFVGGAGLGIAPVNNWGGGGRGR